MNVTPRSAAPRRRSLAFLFTALLTLLSLPAPAQAWWNQDWAYRKQITIDAGSTGADIKADVSGQVVLVRLHDGVFNFAEAGADGADLRFVADDDQTPLVFHIEKYDSVFNIAFVWVQLPAVKAGASQAIWMYYGNAEAVPGSDAKATYDANQTLVYHFGERGTPVADSTGYGHLADNAVEVTDGGLVGNSARLDGQNLVRLPAKPSLAVPAGGTLTWSAWIKPAAAGVDAVLYSQSSGGNPGLVIGLAKGQLYMDVTDATGEMRQSPFSPPITDTNWHHVALVAGVQTTLFVDGQPGPAFALPLPALDGAPTLGGEIGADGSISGGFQGEIDELQLSKVTRDPTAIRLAAINQGTQDLLVQFGTDEGQGGHSGYFGVILAAVTFDAWVVIGVLAVMALVSWWVMYTKGLYTGSIHRANAVFNTQFQTLRQDLTTLESKRALSEDERKQIQKSSMFRMYEVGVREILHRFEIQGHASALSAESIEAIRASVDAESVRENQRLSKGMVLLTIAISGGPFVGLLGTVVGVMITFAAVAAAGEVNINAIAPGISAALLATAAGMFVAIPALFGYNYLLTRIKEIQANMAVFVDEFVTRMAEMYPASALDKP
ncbi:MAG TPA: DUF2341 domain-containing protein [Solimonas sp.]|nr:DUF2341 domain-containing protein [Solimonas sp.]